jgi:hypothetical protein
MSNRDRIAHAAQEAEATRKEKEKASAARAANPTKRAPASKAKAKAAKPAGRTRVVWAVCDPSGATIDTYPYPKEAEARAEAERLSESMCFLLDEGALDHFAIDR